MSDTYETVGAIRRACARNHTIHGHHNPDCTCTHECGDHLNHCKGCLPATATIGGLCTRCYDETRDALNSIPELVALVARRTDGKLSLLRQETDATRRSTLAHAPSPSPAWDAAEEMCQWMLFLALACADENHHRGPFIYRRDGVPARNLTTLTRYVVANLPWYAADIPVDIYAEATGYAKNLERMSGTDHLIHRVKAPCPTCDRRTLVREDGSGEVQCKNRACGRIWREGEFDWMAHVAVS